MIGCSLSDAEHGVKLLLQYRLVCTYKECVLVDTVRHPFFVEQKILSDARSQIYSGI